MKKNTIFAVAGLLLTLAMAVISWILLPDPVVMQMNSQGAGSTFPKIFAVLLPVAFGLYGSWQLRGEVNGRALIFTALGVLMPGVTLLFNL